MCGIVGYTGEKQATNILIEGLSKLEYRGYDSAGILVVEKENIETIKAVGKIQNLKDKVDTKNLTSNIGMGHTRWATHGVPNETNCHPHKVRRVTVVHNGIIENYIELKENLIKQGYIFNSDTDTEVASALIDSIYNGNKIETLEKAIKILKGSYALSIMFEDEKDTLYAMRKESPLVIGVGINENFIASDIPAFLKHTNKYIELEEKVVVKINKDKIEQYKDGIKINNEIKEATWTIEDAEKNGYEHFMKKEMNEQSAVLDKLVAKYITNEIINNEVVDLEKYEDIHFVTCGSAYHAGLVAEYLLNTYANTKEKRINIKSEVASEYRYNKQIYSDNTLVVLISQSGETADTLAALKMAKEANIDTLAVVNVQSSSIAKQAKYMMPILAGPEIAVATTKGYFAQVALLSMMTLKLTEQKNLMTKEELKEITKEIKTISNEIKEILNNEENIKKIAKQIYNKEDIFFIGRSLDYTVGLEGSLKLKEISYINSNTYQAGELKHGPIALIKEGTPVIALCTKKDVMEKTISNIKEVKARGAHVVLLTTDEINELIPDETNKEVFYDNKIVVKQTSEFSQALTTIVPLQMLSYEVAKLRECDIDKPKNLAKSVTVE